MTHEAEMNTLRQERDKILSEPGSKEIIPKDNRPYTREDIRNLCINYKEGKGVR